MKAVVILGATSGIGRAIAQRLAARGESLFLLGRNPGELDRSAADLEARHPERRAVDRTHCDLEQPEGFAAALDAAGDFDTVIVTAGLFATQQALEDDVDLARRLMTVNYANTVVFCEHVRKRLLARGGGQLAVCSSVAGDRGRKPVAIYGSSKAGLSAYLEAIDHKFHDAGLRVLTIKPGFVRTAMTSGLEEPPFAGEVDTVATDVLAAMDAGASVVYTPRAWRPVMSVVKRLPRFVMRKVGF
jgi:short-subunit dehydrogenase